MRTPKEQRSPHDLKFPETSTAPFSAPAPSAPATPHTRQGDRGDDDDADDARRLPVFVRFKDLVAAGIAPNWPTLLRMVTAEDFPTGVMLARNTRAWRLDEVEAWLDTRPTARKVVPPRSNKQELESA
jgi:predicted DNA-binding transcriptional regulator AlpA